MWPITIFGISKGITISTIIIFANIPAFGIFFAINIPSGIWIINARKENSKLRIKENVKSDDEKSCLNQWKPTHIKSPPGNESCKE